MRISAADRTFANTAASDGKITKAEHASLEKRGFTSKEIRALTSQAAEGQRALKGAGRSRSGPVAQASIAPLVAIVGGVAARKLATKFGAGAATGAVRLLYKHGGRASRSIENARSKYSHESQRSTVIDAIRGAKRLGVNLRYYEFNDPFRNPGHYGSYRTVRVR